MKNDLEQEVLVRTNKYHVLCPNFAIYGTKSVSHFLLMTILSVKFDRVCFVVFKNTLAREVVG